MFETVTVVARDQHNLSAYVREGIMDGDVCCRDRYPVHAQRGICSVRSSAADSEVNIMVCLNDNQITIDPPTIC